MGFEIGRTPKTCGCADLHHERRIMIYECSKCEATDCKLWREASTFRPVALVCFACLEAKGYELFMGGDQIYNPDIEPASYVPAVPDLDGSWWGYSSVPSWWVAWWKGLPDRRTDCTLCLGTSKLDGKYDCCKCKATGKRLGADSIPLYADATTESAGDK